MAKDQRTCKICLKWRQRHRFRVNQKYKLQKLHKYTDQWPLTMTRDLPRIVTCRPHHSAWLWHITTSVWIKLDAMVVTAAEIHGLSRWRCSLLAASPRKILIFCGNGCSSTPSDPNQNTEPNWDCTRSLHHHMNLSGKPPRRGSCARGRCRTWVLEVGVLGADEAPSFVQPWRYVKVRSRLKAGWKDNMLKTSETMETWCQMAARSTPKWFQDVRTLPNCHQVALRGSNSKNRWVPWTNPHFPPWPWLITVTSAHPWLWHGAIRLPAELTRWPPCPKRFPWKRPRGPVDSCTPKDSSKIQHWIWNHLNIFADFEDFCFGGEVGWTWALRNLALQPQPRCHIFSSVEELGVLLEQGTCK